MPKCDLLKISMLRDSVVLRRRMRGSIVHGLAPPTPIGMVRGTVIGTVLRRRPELGIRNRREHGLPHDQMSLTNRNLVLLRPCLESFSLPRMMGDVVEVRFRMSLLNLGGDDMHQILDLRRHRSDHRNHDCYDANGAESDANLDRIQQRCDECLHAVHHEKKQYSEYD